MRTVESFTTTEASPARLGEIRRLCEAAFGPGFSDDDWEHALGGRHIVALDETAIVAHAAVVPRAIAVAARPFDTGYVEAVATHPIHQGQGLAATVMREVAGVIRDGFEMGALSTGLHDFYERLGWERWHGPSYVRADNELRRSEDEDDGIMVLRFGPSAEVDLMAAISCEARSGDDW